MSLTSLVKTYQWTPPMMDRTMERKVRNIRHLSMGEEYPRSQVTDPLEVEVSGPESDAAGSSVPFFVARDAENPTRPTAPATGQTNDGQR